MTNTTAAAAPEAKKEKGASPALVAFDYKAGTQTFALWTHKDADGKLTGGHGYVVKDGKQVNFLAFFNPAKEAEGDQPARKLSVKLSTEVEGGKHETVGYINAINSSNNPERPCYFDSVAVNMADKSGTVFARVTKACTDDIRQALGFTQAQIERPKKEAPAAETAGEADAGEGQQAERPRQRG